MAIIIALLIFIIGMISINFIKTEVTSARGLIDCTTPATDGTKLMCLNIDIVIPYIMLVIFSIAGGVITEKFLI